MKSFLKFIGLFAGILILSAILSPILYGFLPFKFERIFRRLVMIMTLAALAWAVKTRRLRFPLEALQFSAGWSRLLLGGFCGGVLTLAALTMIKAGLGLQSWTLTDQSAGAWAGRISLSLFSAVLIGVIEEGFFRGFIFCYIRDRWKWSLPANLAVTNAFYSIVHFLEAKKPFIGPHPDFFDGLRLIAAPLRGLSNWEMVLPGAVGLFIFGCILSLLFFRSGSLYPCIGLHAGCVFYLKMMGSFTFHEQVHPLIFGSSKGYDGFLGWGALILMGIIMLRFVKGKRALLVCFLGAGVFLSALPGSALRAEDLKKNWVSFEPDEESVDSVPAPVASRSSSPLSPAVQPVEDETIPSVPQTVSTAKEALSEKVSEKVPPARKIMSVTASALKDETSIRDIPAHEEDIASMLSEVEASLDGQALPESSTTVKAQPSSLPAVREMQPVASDREVHAVIAKSEAPEVASQSPHENITALKAAPEPIEIKRPIEAPNEALSREPWMPQDSEEKAKKNMADQGEPAAVKKPAFVLKAAPAIQPKAVSSKNSSAPVSSGMPKLLTTSRPSRPVPVYDLVEGEPLNLTKYLGEAEVYNIRDQIEVLSGVWKDDGYHFPGEEESSTIRIRQLEFDGTSETGIYVEPLVNTIRRVRFFGVPAGNKLIFRYGIADEGFLSNAKSTVYVKVWAGQHVLKRIRVLNERGWKTEEIDMGVLSFMKEPVVLTFDISADDVTKRYFCFYAEIQ